MLWDTQRRRPPVTLAEAGVSGEEDAGAVAWSPDGQVFVARTAQGFVSWDARTRRARSIRLGERTDWTNGLAWSPDGRSLAVGAASGVIRLWDPATGTVRATLEGLPNEKLALAWSPDSRFLTGVMNHDTTRLWDVDRGTVVATIAAAGGEVGWAGGRAFVAHPERGWVVVDRLADGARLHLRSVASGDAERYVAWTDHGWCHGDADLLEQVGRFRLGPDLLDGELVTAAQLRERFERPTLLHDFFAGESLETPPDRCAGVGRPP
jgi:WD40 repeat protein